MRDRTRLAGGRCIGIALVALASSACMGGTADVDSSVLVSTITITESDYGLSPGAVNLDKPGNYVFHVVNQGKTEHGLKITGTNFAGSLDAVDPGKSADLSVTISQPGTYDLFSPQGDDRSRGMAASVVVNGG